MNSEFKDLSSALNAHRVKYLVVGGYAVIHYTEPRARIDILTSIRGVRFETAWRNRVRAKYEDLRVNFISRRDLMRNKGVVGRPQDLIDLEHLKLAGKR